MFEEYEKKKKKQVSLMKSIMDYSMGFIFVVLGVLFLLKDKLGLRFSDFFTTLQIKIFGFLFIAYGAWRLYKGYKKNYFR